MTTLNPTRPLTSSVPWRSTASARRRSVTDPQSISATLPLGEALVAEGLIRREDLEGTLSKQTGSRRRLGELLIEMGLIEEDRLLPFLGQRLGLRGVKLRDGLTDPRIVRMIPRGAAERLWRSQCSRFAMW